MLDHQTSLKTLQRTKIIQMIFSDYNRIKLKLKTEKNLKNLKYLEKQSFQNKPFLKEKWQR